MSRFKPSQNVRPYWLSTGRVGRTEIARYAPERTHDDVCAPQHVRPVTCVMSHNLWLIIIILIISPERWTTHCRTGTTVLRTQRVVTGTVIAFFPEHFFWHFFFFLLVLFNFNTLTRKKIVVYRFTRWFFSTCKEPVVFYNSTVKAFLFLFSVINVLFFDQKTEISIIFKNFQKKIETRKNRRSRRTWYVNSTSCRWNTLYSEYAYQIEQTTRILWKP